MADETLAPADCLYDAQWGGWVRLDGEVATVGVTHAFCAASGELLAFTPKPVGAEVAQGRALGLVELVKAVMAVHAPVGGRIVAANAAAQAEPALIGRDPYGEGWLVRLAPTDWAADAARLMDAAAFAAASQAWFTAQGEAS